MEIEKVGQAIAFLRKRADFTQKDLAARLGVSDKAVSKWERGLGLPDVSLLGKLSILLDTDTDSLLAGDVIHHDKGWQGLLILDDNPYGIGPETFVYDKPLVYYLLSYFLLVGIKRIRLVCSREAENYICHRLLDDTPLDIELSFSRSLGEAAGDEAFLRCDNLMIVFGLSLIYGVDQTRFFQKAMANPDRLTLLTLPKGTRKGTTFIQFNNERKIVTSDQEEKLFTQYDYCDIPILFCPKQRFLRAFGDGSGSDAVIGNLLQGRDVYIEPLDRGFVEIRLDDRDAVTQASEFVRIVQEHCGMVVYCIEEVAWRRGMISLGKMRLRGERLRETDYGKYLLDLCSRNQE